MTLSPREQRILDSIATELGEEDPALGATFAEPRLSSSFWQRSPLSRSHAGVLVFALLTLIVLHPLALTLGLAGLAILTGALIVPWMVSVARTETGPTIRFRKPRGHGLTDPDTATIENQDWQIRNQKGKLS